MIMDNNTKNGVMFLKVNEKTGKAKWWWELEGLTPKHYEVDIVTTIASFKTKQPKYRKEEIRREDTTSKIPVLQLFLRNQCNIALSSLIRQIFDSPMN